MPAHNSEEGTERIALRGPITLSLVQPLLPQIRRAARQTRGTLFQLDCAAVTDISSQALAALLKLRRDVRPYRCDLVLINCGASLTTSIQSSIFRSLLSEESAVKKEPVYEGPHTAFQVKWKSCSTRKNRRSREAYFLRLPGTRYQRFWLN
jgi:ABC-type transporter Mla MlaB component